MSYRENFAWKGIEEDYYSFHSYHVPTYEEQQELLEPLIRQLELYESVKREIMQFKVSVNKLRELSGVLREKKSMDGMKFSLHETESIKTALHHNNLWDVQLDVRRGHMQLPKYLLCDQQRNWYGNNYGVITAEFFKSADYQLPDPRFIKLMNHSHEEYNINMAGFREKVQSEFFNGKRKGGSKKTGQLLTDIGENFLQTTWHEDQVIAWMLSKHFDLPKFKEVMELLYFILGSDLCAVRQQVNNNVKGFFEKIYVQPSLLIFLENIEISEGSEFQSLETRARNWYRTISKTLNSLLQCNITWGMFDEIKIPLYKVVFANIYRLEMVVENAGVKKNNLIREKCGLLENVSIKAINDMIDFDRKKQSLR